MEPTSGPERSRHDADPPRPPLPALVAYWDSDQRNVLANDAYRAWFGRSPVQMKGRRIDEVLDADVYEQNRPFIEAALAGEEQSFDRTVRDAHGATRHTRASYVPDLAPDGSVVGFFAVITDATPAVEAEKRLERSVEQYRALARSLPGSFVLVFDESLHYVIADGAALAGFSMVPSDFEGRTLSEALPDRPAELETYYRAALAGTITNWDRTVGHHTYELSAGPVFDAEGVVFAGMVVGRDVTADRRREARDAALREIAEASARRSTTSEIFGIVARSAREVFSADYAVVVRYEEGGGHRIVAVDPDAGGKLDGVAVADLDKAVGAEVARIGKPAVARYEETDEGLAGRLHQIGIRSGAGAPVRVRGKVWGTIALGSGDPEAMDQETLDALTDFAEVIELTISNAEAWDALNLQARTDELTGLANRRAFDERLTAELAALRRSGRPLSLALIDLDNLKDVNDALGHPAGDRALCAVARVIDAATRANELAARLGGDEFAVLMPDCPSAAAAAAADRIRSAAAELEPVGGMAPTLSAGVFTTDRPDLTPEQVLAAADEVLYAAKRAGRNVTKRAAAMRSAAS